MIPIACLLYTGIAYLYTWIYNTSKSEEKYSCNKEKSIEAGRQTKVVIQIHLAETKAVVIKEKEQSAMKRSYSPVMLAIFLLAAILTAGCSPAAEDTFSEESGWTIVLECKTTHTTCLIGFLNEDFGISVGYRGEIHYTCDGGQTWAKGENNSADRFCLDIIDKSIAWCSGNMGNVCMSSDGGKTWTLVSSKYMTVGHSNIDFVDVTAGWVASYYELAGTSDGGKTWTKIPLPEGADGIASICLRTPENGYLLSRDGMLYATTDGGTTWSSQDLGFKNYDIIDLQKQPKLNKSIPTIADISFTDENNGTIVFIGLSSSGKGYHTWCLTTSDGGATWESELLHKSGFSPSKVFISGDGQYLTLTDSNNNAVVLKKI